MTTRGATVKHDTLETLTLLRPMITRRYVLVVDHEKCCGCKICALVCPQEAISLSDAELAEGRVKSPPRIDIDSGLCNFCGECVVMCPTHALSMTVNGEPEVPVLKGDAFPMLIRTMKVEQAPCEQDLRLARGQIVRERELLFAVGHPLHLDMHAALDGLPYIRESQLISLLQLPVDFGRDV